MAANSGISRSLPVVLAVILFLACICCCGLIWRAQAERNAAASEDQARLAALQEEKAQLENILRLQPCEVQKKVLARKKAASAAAAEKNRKPEPVSAVSASPDDVERACVFIVSAAGASHLATGSGFFVAPGYVATNRHVVENAKGKIFVTSKALGRPVLGKVAAKGGDNGQDYALVAVKMPPGANIGVLNFAPEVKKTEKVGAWGFPDLVGKNDPGYARLLRGEDFASVPELSYSEGVVSATLDRKPRLIVHTAPISPGNSGGPLVNERGEVVGINTMITLDEGSYRQASLAIAAEDLSRFMRANGIEARSGR